MNEHTLPRCIAIVGRGRLGRALHLGFSKAGYDVRGPLSRTYGISELSGAEAVLLCVADREITEASVMLSQRLADSQAEPLIGHCSGASTLTVLQGVASHRCFSLHPLTAVTGDHSGNWDGVPGAISGGSADSLAVASRLARDLGMDPFVVEEADRAAYHAAASIASNFLITLQAAAAKLAWSAGCEREVLVPLVRQTVENWAELGVDALTGPVARGDIQTVKTQREAVAERTPELLCLFDACRDATVKLTAKEIAA